MKIRTRKLAPLALSAALALGVTACASDGADTATEGEDVTTDDGMTDDGMTDDGMTDDGMTDDGVTDGTEG